MRYVRPPEGGFGVVAEATRKSMRANRGRDTRLELDFRRALREAGMLGYRLHRRDLPGRPDVAWIGRRLAVFVHGCFWHGCERCGRYRLPKSNTPYWSAKVEENRARDARHRAALEAQGYRVLVLWECEVRTDLSACIARVAELLAPLSPAAASLPGNPPE